MEQVIGILHVPVTRIKDLHLHEAGRGERGEEGGGNKGHAEQRAANHRRGRPLGWRRGGQHCPSPRSGAAARHQGRTRGGKTHVWSISSPAVLPGLNFPRVEM
jgi:hypothetical protein